MPGIINTGTHPKLLWPGVKAIWGMTYDEHQEEFTDLFDVETSDKAYEEILGLASFGLASIKSEGGPGTYDSEIQGYVSRWVHVAYSLGYKVTFEELRDNLYKEVASRRAKALAFSFRQTTENVCAFLYNNATSSAYFTTGDGVALASASHINVSGDTFSNILSPGADISEAALEDLTTQIMGTQNDRGLLVNIMPRSLHVSRQDWYEANRIMQSVLQPNTASNNINVLKAQNVFPEGIKMNHYFTNPSRWFVRTNAPEGMTMYWRDKPFMDQDNDFDTKNACTLGYMRFSVGCGDPRGLFTSDGP